MNPWPRTLVINPFVPSAMLLLTLASVAPAGNHVVGWGANTYGQTNAPVAATNVMAIAAGLSHSLALKADGTVLAWGQAGRTNVPAGLSNVVAIAAGRGQSLALKADGTLVAWGVPNTAATTNIPSHLTNIVAIACGDDHNLVLRENGTVFAWGANYSGQTTVPASLSNVVAIVAGNTGNLAIKADGTTWGSGAFTNLLSGYSNVVGGALVANGNFQGAVLRGDGAAQIWGYPGGDHDESSKCHRLGGTQWLQSGRRHLGVANGWHLDRLWHELLGTTRRL